MTDDGRDSKTGQFQLGHIGIGGRPKGSRNKLGEAFVEAMHADFIEHGQPTIVKVREEKPDQYLKVIASLLPKELQIADTTLSDFSDNELAEYYAAVRALAASVNGKATGRRNRKAATEEDTGETGRLN